LRGRLYAASEMRPRGVPILVRQRGQDSLRRYPMPETALDSARIQPYVHDVVIHFRYRGQQRRFLLFFNRHKRLPINLALPRGCRRGYKGDVIV
ncbi:hypothetical protein PUNSTDRAFT_35251, partial [Punctularia strigosozonata HHB-11173 SS5]|uniref:uncharacterized protein n=1 Tax=Punctularia strigosozonata (strain HHB-11173) TaxID=741275 RepID=UPI0004417B0B